VIQMECSILGIIPVVVAGVFGYFNDHAHDARKIGSRIAAVRKISSHIELPSMSGNSFKLPQLFSTAGVIGRNCGQHSRRKADSTA
jgi:hypothetical protein